MTREVVKGSHNGIHGKRLKISWHGLAVPVIVVLATFLRLALLAQGFPLTSSDEGTVGLMAMHIAYRGALPIFYYGQGYMGPFEAYFGALLFHLFGPSLFTLRLGLALVFACFLVSAYLLIRLLYTRSWALLMLLLLSLGTSNTIARQLTALGGYPETLLFSALSFLLAIHLALSWQGDPPVQQQRRRYLLYGCWGLLVGLGTWTDTLVVPFALLSGLILVRFCWHELRRWAGKYLLLGLLIGLAPVIIYNIIVPFRTLTDLWNVDHTAYANIPITLPFFLQNIVGTFIISVPSMIGGYPLCPLTDLPPFGPGSAATLRCTMVQASWSLGYLALMTFAIALAWRGFHQRWQQQRNTQEMLPAPERAIMIHHFARLMLLGSAVLTIALFTLSPVSAQTPSGSARYLIGLLLCTPAVLWPLWRGIGAFRQHGQKFAYSRLALQGALLLCIGILAVLGTLNIFTSMPAVRAHNQEQDALIAHLLRLHATHIYSEYDTCNRLIFLTQEHIICSVLDPSLRPGVDRYALYTTIVHSDPRATYVFPQTSVQAAALARSEPFSARQYKYFNFDGYVIYQPV